MQKNNIRDTPVIVIPKGYTILTETDSGVSFFTGECQVNMKRSCRLWKIKFSGMTILQQGIKIGWC